jgi:signal transduction histidine kinase
MTLAFSGRARRRPSQAADLYEELFELAPDAYVFTTPSGRILEVNRAACALFNRPRILLVGAVLPVFLPQPAYHDLIAELPPAPDDADVLPERDVVIKPVGCLPVPVAVTVGVARDSLGRRSGYRWLFRDITEREREQARRRASLRGRELRLREQEARRIARELHDQAGQLLASLHFELEEMGAALEPAGRARIGRLRSMVDEIEAQLRRISHEIRSPILDDLGLVAALDFVARGLARRSGLTLSVQGPPARLPPEVETHLYRVVQEALSNVARHARARRAWVDVQVAGREATVVVRDDGCGFAVGQPLARAGEHGMGLLNMRERVDALGGQLRLDSAPGAGTRVHVSVPLPAATGRCGS